MQKTCRQCSSAFEITPSDLAFYEKVSPVFHGKKELIPPPTLCPDCRQRRRLSYRNERMLYRRTCDKTGRPIISVFSPDKPFTVYERDYWWSDAWDPREFGRTFDFSRPFFEQFHALASVVPKLAINNSNTENSDYTNYSFNLKNCYLILGWGENSEQCLYGKLVVNSRDCVDVLHALRCELCYDSIDLTDCYRCFFCRFCSNCAACWFSENCQGCRDCFGCMNLRNQTHCLFNEQKTQEEYERELATLLALGNRLPSAMQERWQAVRLSVPHKELHGTNTIDCSGDYLHHCKGAHNCFDVNDGEDLRCFTDSMGAKDCMDCSIAGGNDTELSYECVSYTGQRTLFSDLIWFCHDMLYCMDCFSNSHDCFGCVGLKKGSYCILNKQYTKEEYETLIPKIIEKMRADGEWGEFFPVAMSPFAYNETVAQEYFPMTKEEVMKRGWQWRDETDEIPKVEKIIPAAQLPDSIDDISDDILNWAVACEATGKPFKIIKQELEFYRTMHLPVPRFHPDERHRRRMALRNPRKLWDRECMKCGKAITTSYSPDRPEIVFCESCYLKEVY